MIVSNRKTAEHIFTHAAGQYHFFNLIGAGFRRKHQGGLCRRARGVTGNHLTHRSGHRSAVTRPHHGQINQQIDGRVQRSRRQQIVEHLL
ncbi:MAG: hypothetical protein U0694_19185 [Anaerolineae bacterium]